MVLWVALLGAATLGTASYIFRDRMVLAFNILKDIGIKKLDNARQVSPTAIRVDYRYQGRAYTVFLQKKISLAPSMSNMDIYVGGEKVFLQPGVDMTVSPLSLRNTVKIVSCGTTVTLDEKNNKVIDLKSYVSD